MRRKKTGSKNQVAMQQQRASFPLSRPQLSESRVAQNLEQQFNNHPLSHNGDLDSSQDQLEGKISTKTLSLFHVNPLTQGFFTL